MCTLLPNGWFICCTICLEKSPRSNASGGLIWPITELCQNLNSSQVDWDKGVTGEWGTESPKNLFMCINISQPGVLSEPFPTPVRWRKYRRKHQLLDSSLRVSSFTICSLPPLLCIFLLDQKLRHMVWPWKKNEIKTVPENPGHMLSKTGATWDCTQSGPNKYLHWKSQPHLKRYFVFSSKILSAARFF